MKSIAKTYSNWFEEIFNSFLTYSKKNKKVSNAFIEGKNRLFKEIKAIGCGYKNFWINRARLLYISANKPIAFNSSENKRKKFKKIKKEGEVIHPRIFYSFFSNPIIFYRAHLFLFTRKVHFS